MTTKSTFRAKEQATPINQIDLNVDVKKNEILSSYNEESSTHPTTGIVPFEITNIN